MLSWSTARSLLIAACLLIAGTVVAGELDELKNTTPAERAKAQTAMMKAKLGLSEDQVAKVGALNLKYAEKMDPIIKGTEGPFMKARDAKNVEQEKEDELKTLGQLTAAYRCRCASFGGDRGGDGCSRTATRT